jgi:hypothetical protein
MDHDAYDIAVGANAHTAILQTVGSVQGAAKESGIAYTTLDRKLKGLASFTVAELRRLAKVTQRRTADFLPRETGRR